MERGKNQINSMENIKIPIKLEKICSELEKCDNPAKYKEICLEFEKISVENSDINLCLKNIKLQSEELSEIEPKKLINLIKEFYSSEESKNSKLNLDTESLQNIKNELLKTYQENNISFLANEAEIGLVEPIISATKRDLPNTENIEGNQRESEIQQPVSHIFAIPNSQVFCERIF